MNMYENNNYLAISGVIVQPFEFDHESSNGRRYWNTTVQIHRLSENSDYIRMSVPETMIETGNDYVGKYVEAFGTLRAFSKYDENGKRHISVLACPNELEIKSEEEDHCNYVMVKGVLHRPAIYRITPSGKEISDVLVRVYSPSRTDFINCILWGRNALYVSAMPIGTKLKLTGRLQSRQYKKKLSDDSIETRIAYELSVNEMEEIKSNEESNA